MDHGYIEQHSVPGRYVGHALAPPERAQFEAHLVDCQECTDRVLLAEMFHSRNGAAKQPADARPADGPPNDAPPADAPQIPAPAAPDPQLAAPGAPLKKARVLAISPWLFWLVTAALLLLLLVPCGFFLWELHTLRP